MNETVFADSAKVMAKGQVTIPKGIREVLGLGVGDRVVFVVDNGGVRLVNSAIYAMTVLLDRMTGEAAKVGLDSEDAVNDLIKEMRGR